MWMAETQVLEISPAASQSMYQQEAEPGLEYGTWVSQAVSYTVPTACPTPQFKKHTMKRLRALSLNWIWILTSHVFRVSMREPSHQDSAHSCLNELLRG